VRPDGFPGIDRHFIEGHLIDPDLADRIPDDAIGRLMTAADARKLIDRLDQIPKKPPAPSVRRSRRRKPQRTARRRTS
jgi:hypothetical protein